MDNKEFRKNAHQVVDWIADYMENIESFPVKSQVLPGEIYEKFDDKPPDTSQPFAKLMDEVDDKIMPGISHWQHPNFHAFFPANNSYPSILGEMITAGIGAQCMIWETSPAAAELEEKTLHWLKQMMSLPMDWSGVIQDTASTSTLAALLDAREKKTNFSINQDGFQSNKLRIYCSSQTHSSIDKAVKIAGFGSSNLVKIAVDDTFAMSAAALKAAIEQDLKDGLIPCAVVTTLGTTSTMAMDPLQAINDLCAQYGVWNHVDAAYAGNGFILPEDQHYIEDLSRADSYVFNPHKWLFVNFDCSVFFVKDKSLLIRTFEILPEYLKTKNRGEVSDYRDWGIPLGRRFRALKLWMVISTYGVEGLKKTIKGHNNFAVWLENQIENEPDFEMMSPRVMNLVVFRYAPADHEDLNQLNEQLLQTINKGGKAYLTHTKINGQYVIRLVTGQTYLTEKHVTAICNIIKSETKKL
jgi:aromatic-L-amino-acid decarboxylase